MNSHNLRGHVNDEFEGIEDYKNGIVSKMEKSIVKNKNILKSLKNQKKIN